LKTNNITDKISAADIKGWVMTEAWKVTPRKRNVVKINRLCARMSETDDGLFLKQTIPFF
jgi:hypothetical protein